MGAQGTENAPAAPAVMGAQGTENAPAAPAPSAPQKQRAPRPSTARAKQEAPPPPVVPNGITGGNGNGHDPAQAAPGEPDHTPIIMPLDGTRSDAAAPKKKTRVRPKSRQKKGQTA